MTERPHAAPAAQVPVGPSEVPASALAQPPVADPRRHARIRHLRELVSRGLYRIPTEALAERLVQVLEAEMR